MPSSYVEIKHASLHSALGESKLMCRLKKSDLYWMPVSLCVLGAIAGVIKRDFELVEKGLLVFVVGLSAYQICMFFIGKTMFFLGVIARPDEKGYRVFSLIFYVILLVTFFLFIYL